ncbi:hypothetical protein GCM10027612_85800 [Microbispora bryophytorum subsp. camponoti]
MYGEVQETGCRRPGAGTEGRVRARVRQGRPSARETDPSYAHKRLYRVSQSRRLEEPPAFYTHASAYYTHNAHETP